MDCSSLYLHRSQRILFPPGSAYRSETGGLMEALRVLTVEQSNHSITPPTLTYNYSQFGNTTARITSLITCH